MSQRPHGYARYGLDGCRCNACGYANSRYQEIRAKAITAGTWKPYVDAQPVRDHLAALSDAGLGWRRAAEVAGIAVSIVQNLMYGRYGDPPARQIRPHNAAALLSVRVTLDTLADGAVTDGTGTRRRVQGMCALGWSLSEQARRLGWNVGNYQSLAHGERAAVTTARLVRDLADSLTLANPPAGHAADRTRRWAASRRWLPLLAWDEDALDDPAATPNLGLLIDDEEADEVAVWWALQGQIGAETLADVELAVYHRHRRENDLVPRGQAQVVEAYLAALADGCDRHTAAVRLSVPLSTLDTFVSKARRAGDPRLARRCVREVAA